jgi:hypothetical protein
MPAPYIAIFIALALASVCPLKAASAPTSHPLTLIIDRFTNSGSQKYDADEQFPMMLEAAIEDVLKGSPFVDQVAVLDPDRYADILAAKRGYKTHEPASAASDLAQRTAPNYKISGFYHYAQQNVWSVGARIVDLSNGTFHAVGMVNFRPDDNEAFRPLALELKQEIYRLKNVPEPSTSYTLAVCIPEFQAYVQSDPNLRQVVTGMIAEQLPVSLRQAVHVKGVTVEEQTTNCANGERDALGEGRNLNRLLMKVRVWLPNQRNVVYYFLEIVYRTHDIAVVPERNCEPDQLADAFKDAVGEIARDLETKIADLDVSGNVAGGNK